MSAPSETFRLLEEGRERSLVAQVNGDQVLVSADSLQNALGWELKPEGLCKGSTCVPVRDPAALSPSDGAVDLAAFAAALGRPLAVEPARRIAALGTAADERAAQLASLQAPDFELPDLSGQLHRLSDHRGKKVLLIAYASW